MEFVRGQLVRPGTCLVGNLSALALVCGNLSRLELKKFSSDTFSWNLSRGNLSVLALVGGGNLSALALVRGGTCPDWTSKIFQVIHFRGICPGETCPHWHLSGEGTCPPWHLSGQVPGRTSSPNPPHITRADKLPPDKCQGGQVPPGQVYLLRPTTKR